MKLYCPNKNCDATNFTKQGTFKRACDSRKIQRFQCKKCLKKFSKATFTLDKRQQIRRKNSMLFKLLASNVSQRRAAKILGISRGTVARRLIYFAERSRKRQKKYLENLEGEVSHMQMDDLITKENSKLKPLSITIAVDAKKGVVLGAEVSQIPSFGHLAKISKKKYGPRKCHHQQGIERLLGKIQATLKADALIRSDEHHKYPSAVRKFFPNAKHEVFKSARSCVAGQGELKKQKFDPIFAVDHTCAMFRANINRLIRKTWCTTKDPVRLQDHVDLFISYYNRHLRKLPELNSS